MPGNQQAIENTILRVLHASDPSMRGNRYELQAALVVQGVNATNDEVLEVAKDMEERGLLTNVEFGTHISGSLTQEGHLTAETLT
jgi:hypothetical protein